MNKVQLTKEQSKYICNRVEDAYEYYEGQSKAFIKNKILSDCLFDDELFSELPDEEFNFLAEEIDSYVDTILD